MKYAPMAAPVFPPDVVVIVPRYSEADMREMAHVWNWRLEDVKAFIAKLEKEGLLKFVERRVGHA